VETEPSVTPRLGTRSSTLLNQNIKNLAFIVHYSPKPHPSPIDLHDNHIEVPATRWRIATPADIRSDQRTKMFDPAPVRFSADVNTALRQQFLDVSQAQCAPKIEPDGRSDDVWRVPVSLERQGFRDLVLQIGDPAESGDILA
jgi:hypothetical protein